MIQLSTSGSAAVRRDVFGRKANGVWRGHSELSWGEGGCHIKYPASVNSFYCLVRVVYLWEGLSESNIYPKRETKDLFCKWPFLLLKSHADGNSFDQGKSSLKSPENITSLISRARVTSGQEKCNVLCRDSRNQWPHLSENPYNVECQTECGTPVLIIRVLVSLDKFMTEAREGADVTGTRREESWS